MPQKIVHTAVVLILSTLIGCSGKKDVAPILVLATDRKFGTYTAEILKTEGFKDFRLDSIASGRVNPSYLEQFNMVILAESEIGPEVQQMIQRYVNKGGNLIAFRPDPELAGLFGIVPEGLSLEEGYIRIDTAAGQGGGLVPGPLQFHGAADIYAAKGCTILATLYADRNDPAGSPAVVTNTFGKGHTAAFLYNLPKSIVFTRQGNPLLAGIEKDGIPGLRGMDLFTDGWVDTANNIFNQADEQMALFSHCIEHFYGFSGPLPRFWYFPDTLECLVTLTNDGEYKGEADFESQFRDVDSMGAKMSIYVLDADQVTREWVDKWTARGFEISGHPDDTREAGNPGWYTMDSALSAKKNEISVRYGLDMHTVVNHWFVWCGRDSSGVQDFGAQARLEERNGIEMDINYAHYDMKSNQGNYYLGTTGTNHGNFTGSGMVMRYADVRGRTINVFQHFNSVYDQEYTESKDPEGFYNCFKGLVDRSLFNEVYSFISIKSHNDEYYFSKTPLLKMLIYARSMDVPVWTEKNLLDFLKMKDQASMSGMSWKRNTLTFTILSPVSHPAGLTCMVPLTEGAMEIGNITIGGKDHRIVRRKIKGRDYALITVAPGSNYEVSAYYR